MLREDVRGDLRPGKANITVLGVERERERGERERGGQGREEIEKREQVETERGEGKDITFIY